MLSRSRNGSSGFRISLKTNHLPSPAGVHLSIVAPCGTYIATKRDFPAAAVRLSGVCAATIESSSGNATVAPTPRRNVRRDRCLFVMNIGLAGLKACTTPVL